MSLTQCSSEKLKFTGSTASSSIPIYAVIAERKRKDEQLQEITVTLFQEFRSVHFREARLLASKHVRKNWEDPDFKNKFLNEFVGIETKQSVDEDKIKEDYVQAVSDIIGFYTILSVYGSSENHIRKLNYFYYPWWRPFLYDIAEFRDNFRKERVDDLIRTHSLHFDKETFVENIGLMPALKRLDKICGFENIPHQYKFL